MRYDFRSLSDYDFELLCQDLLSCREERRFESFRQGRDQGIDLRYASDGGNVIAQCKHYAGSTFAQLLRAAAREAARLPRLAPARYLFLTSQPLSPRAKDQLLAVLSPWCAGPGDIWGQEDLNQLLREYPQVEKRHYKLWLTSTAVLEKVTHSQICNRSQMAVEHIRRRLCLYVQSHRAFERALQLLETQSCCVISGIPGIGKTTLAEILLIHYLDQGYQICKISGNISEAIEMYQPGTAQIFLYDDFLGSTGLEARLGKNESQDLLAFLEHISLQKRAKCILTTREYILHQAQEACEALSRHDFHLSACVLKLEDYDKLDRGRILYNHLYFSGFSREAVAELLEGERVLDVVNHPNYSPRLVETITQRIRRQPGKGLGAALLEALNNPRDIWSHAFEHQIHRETRELLLVMALFPRLSPLQALQRGYEAYRQARGEAASPADFRRALEEAEGSFLTVDRDGVAYHNPSIQDFIQAYIRERDYEFKALCQGICFFEECFGLLDLFTGASAAFRSDCRGALCGALAAVLETESDFPLSAALLYRLSYIPDSPSRRIAYLIQYNRSLRFPELDSLIKGYFAALPGRIQADGEGPGSYQFLLQELSRPRTVFPELPAALESMQHYFAGWFADELVYEAADFAAFADLSRLAGGTPETLLRPAAEAFADYVAHIARDELSEASYDWQVEELQETVARAGELLGTDQVAYFECAAEDRLEVLEESARLHDFGDDSDYRVSRIGAQPQRDENRLVLELFQGYQGPPLPDGPAAE